MMKVMKMMKYVMPVLAVAAAAALVLSGCAEDDGESIDPAIDVALLLEAGEAWVDTSTAGSEGFIFLADGTYRSVSSVGAAVGGDGAGLHWTMDGKGTVTTSGDTLSIVGGSDLYPGIGEGSRAVYKLSGDNRDTLTLTVKLVKEIFLRTKGVDVK